MLARGYKIGVSVSSLTNLIPELLDMVDEKLPSIAVELSYLDEEANSGILSDARHPECAVPFPSAAAKLAQEGRFSYDVAFAVMGRKKGRAGQGGHQNDTLRKYPTSYTPKQMEDTIIKLLEQWQRKQQRQNGQLTYTVTKDPWGLFFANKEQPMNDYSNRTIRSREITIDVRICAALANRGGVVYLAAIAPDMELTVITLDEAPDILPCFDEDDACLNLPNTSLLLCYNPAQVLKMGGKHYLTGPVILARTNMDGEVISLTIDEVYLFQKYLASHSITLMADDQKLPCICME